MAAEALTTLGRVKEWVGVPADNTAADSILSRLIAGASAFVLNQCNRKGFGKQSFASLLHGYGKQWMTLPEPDVFEVTAVSIAGTPLHPASGDGITTRRTDGYALLDQRLELFGKCFPYAKGSVYVAYSAGFFVDSEAHVIPSGNPHTVTVSRFWLSTETVKINGVVATAVSSSPAAGQYSVSEGVHTFNSADANSAVLISYSYAPDDIVEATTELVGERYRYKDHIGHSSKTLGGQETVAFAANKTPDHILQTLNNYVRVV